MASSQWETVLIDWVNCLKLCKPVHTLDELRNGEFFRHLRKLIKKTTSPIPDDDLTVIFDLLSQHYPGIKFSEKDSVHLKDMHPTDLVNLTSLLMHYTCIYDRRNALTSPMCYSLNLATQLYIKVFLELISNETTNNDLEGVIQHICTENNTTLLGSPVVRNQSPLQTLLKTPASKNIKLIEKSREIERLKLELESEKADRNDCEFELAHFKDKVTELEGHLKQKNSEIKRLRMEVETLKMRTPPEFQDVPARESHKLLQKEIENLEEYIQKCEQEQDTLQKDKDNLKERTRKLENDCTMWQQNFYEIEEKYQSTVEQLRDFELKNDSLEEHCNELQALLSEYQGKKSLDDSLQLEIRRNRRSRGFECSQEDLAHSVVDMQLKEAQKMIEDLTQKLLQTEDQKSLLEKQLLQTVEEKTHLGDTLNKAQIDFDKLQKALTDKSTECDSLKVQISALDVEIDELKQSLKVSKQQEAVSKQLVAKQQEELATLSENLQLSKQQCDRLKDDLEQVQRQLVQEKDRADQTMLELQCVNQSLEEKREQLDLELSKYNAMLDQSRGQIQQLNAELHQLQQSNLAVDTELTRQKEQCIKLQQVITDKCDRLTAQDAVIDSLTRSLDDYNQREMVSEQLITEQREELATLSRNLEQSQSLCDSLKSELEQEKQHTHQFELELQQTQSDNRNLNAQLSKLRTEMDEKCCQLTLAHHELSNYNTKLEAQLLTVDSELKRQTDKVVQLQQLITEKSTECDSLKKALELNNHQETASKQLIQQQQEELATLSRNLEVSMLQLDEAQTERRNLMTELDCATSRLNELQVRFEEVSESKLKLTQEIFDLRTVKAECECLRNELRNKTAVLLQAEQNLEEVREKCNKLDNELLTVNAQITTLQAENDCLKRSLEHSNQQEAVSRQLVKQQQEELATLSRNLELSECDLAHKTEQLRCTDMQLCDLNAQVSKLTTELDEKCCQISQVRLELSTVDTERTEQVEKLHQLLIDKSAQITTLEVENDRLNVELSEQRHQTELQLEKTKNDKQNLEAQLSKLTTQLECHKEQLEELEQCQKALKQLEQLALSKDKEAEVMKGELQEVSATNQTLTKQLNQAVQDLEEFTQQQKVVQTELQESKTDLNNLQQELQTVLEQLEATRLSLNKTQEDAKNLKLEKESVNFYLKDTSKQLDVVESKLEEAQNQIKIAKNQETKLKKRIAGLETECTSLRGELDKLKSELRETVNSKHLVQNNLDEASTKLEILQKNLITKEGELETTKVSLTHANSEKDHFARLVEKLEDRLTELQKVEADKHVLLQSHNETLTELEQTRKDFDRSQKATQVVQNFLDLNTNELRKVSQEKEQLLEALEMSNKDKLDLEEENKSYSLELEKLRQELQLKDCELAELSFNSQQIRKQLEKQLNTKDCELEREQQNTNILTKEKLEILEELQKVTREKEEKQTESTDDKNKLLQDKAEILENLQKVIKEKEELFFELGNISSQLEAIKKENRAIMSDYQDLQNGHKDNESEIKKLLLEKRELEENLEAVKQSHQELTSKLEMSQKEQKELENHYNKLQLEKEDVSKEKNDIYDYLQRSVEDKERTTLERDRLQCECNELKRERDVMFERLQTTAEECQKMALALELSEKETAKVKKERNEILLSQTEIMKDTEHKIVRAHEAAVEERRELLNRVEVTEKERDKLRQAYAGAMATNSKLDLENSTLKKLLDERNHDLSQTSGLKDAYEKLLDDNCRYSKEIEVLKQKRSRDREEFLTLLKKEQEKGKKVDQVRAEYEDKLDKMKERMLKLYREEVQKEMEKVKSEQAGEVAYLQKVNDDLRSELWEVERKAKTLEKECNTYKQNDRHFSSRESMHSNPADQKSVKHMGTSSLRGRSNRVADRNSVMAASCNSLVSRQSYALSKEMVEPKVRSTSHLYGRESSTIVHDRKLSTLPNRLQPGDYVEETVTVSRRTSINSLGRNFEMEDEEEDMFNNKYLTDLKEGRCLLPAGGHESNANRVSELAWRNSMVPPHLKSSYPAELQFVSPTRFNEEDIKTGNVMDDSQCKLLPGEKQRPPKKDFGTTSYKKPGPPTPSKNGGRLSLQGGDVLPMREHNMGRTSTTPKKGTPSRLRALFKGMRDGGAHQRENLENLTPRESKRFSLWNRK